MPHQNQDSAVSPAVGLACTASVDRLCRVKLCSLAINQPGCVLAAAVGLAYVAHPSA